MEQLNRNLSPAPLCLTKLVAGEPNYFRKGKAWRDKYALTGDATKFSWGTHAKKGNSEHIVDALSVISGNHCFYCDLKRVMYGITEPEIDHFCPKTVSPLKAYYYPNLNLCCGSCNRYKLDKYSRNVLLDFTSPNYQFDNYFFVDYATGKVRVRPDISVRQRFQARYTLTVLGINKDARPRVRRDELDAYNNTVVQNIDDFSYRYYISRSI